MGYTNRRLAKTNFESAIFEFSRITSNNSIINMLDGPKGIIFLFLMSKIFFRVNTHIFYYAFIVTGFGKEIVNLYFTLIDFFARSYVLDFLIDYYRYLVSFRMEKIFILYVIFLLLYLSFIN